MYKTELGEVIFSTNTGRYKASLPTSLFSVLTENGVIVNPYYRDQEQLRFLPLCTECEISASFTLSSDAAKLRFAYIRMPELDAPAEIFFNGKSIYTLIGARNHMLDVTGLAQSGENTLLIKVAASDVPRDVTLFEKIEFIAFSRAIIQAISAKPVISPECVCVNVALDLLGDATEVKAVATLISPTGKIYYSGVTSGRTVINVPDPLLWWPQGYGVQNLYKLSVNIYYESEAVDSGDVMLGLRSVICDEREGAAFTVNESEFFAMGAEYKAEGRTPALSLRNDTPALVPAAARANMNYIRFIGRGRYPCEEFLRLCDFHGIVVECVLDREKLIACDSATLRRELAYHFKRMSRHPSVFCVSYDKRGLSQERADIIDEAKNAALSAIYVLKTEGEDSFVPSASVPHKKTLGAILEPEDMNIFSYVMEQHMSSFFATTEMLSLAHRFYKYAYGLDELAYTSGILSSRLQEEYVDSVRLRRAEKGGAVIRCLNDTKPAISYSMIDFGKRPKVSYYRAMTTFAPIKLIVTGTGAASLRFVLSNETKKAVTGILRYTIRDAHNTPIYTDSLTVSSEKYSLSLPIDVALSDYVGEHEREYYLEHILEVDGDRISSGAHLFVEPKHFRFVNPEILAEISGSDREFKIALRASAFAKDVVLRFSGTDAVFEENCIDITDSSVRRISFTTAGVMSAQKLMSELRIMSVFNIGMDA